MDITSIFSAEQTQSTIIAAEEQHKEIVAANNEMILPSIPTKPIEKLMNLDMMD